MNFDIKNYVKSRLDKEFVDTQEEYDKLLNQEENIEKDVRNLIKHFSSGLKVPKFSFNDDVFKYFPINSFRDSDIGLFLDHIIFIKKNKNYVGNKEISNLSKIFTDNKDDTLPCKERRFDHLYYNDVDHSDNINFGWCFRKIKTEILLDIYTLLLK